MDTTGVPHRRQALPGTYHAITNELFGLVGEFSITAHIGMLSGRPGTKFQTNQKRPVILGTLPWHDLTLAQIRQPA